MRTKSLKVITIFMLLAFLIGNVATVLAAPIAHGTTPVPAIVSLRANLVVTETTTTASCQADYVVTSGDTLGIIAGKYTGVSYQAIFEATNAAAAKGGVYSKLTDANMISVGQTLCIPPAGTIATTMNTTVATQTTVTATEATTATTTPTQTVMATLTDGKMMVNGVELPAGKIALSMKNLSPADIIMDIIGPTSLDAQFVIPNTQKVFILEPGSYRFNGASPGGAFTLDPGGFELKAGQWVEVLIYGSFYNQIVHDGTVAPTPAITTTAVATNTPVVTETAATTTPVTSTTRAAVTATATPANNASLAPTPGKARVYLQNKYTSEYNIDFGDGNGLIKVPAGVQNLFYELAPGAYTPGLSLPGGGSANVELTLQADHSWVILVDESASVRVGPVYPEVK